MKELDGTMKFYSRTACAVHRVVRTVLFGVLFVELVGCEKTADAEHSAPHRVAKPGRVVDAGNGKRIVRPKKIGKEKLHGRAKAAKANRQKKILRSQVGERQTVTERVEIAALPEAERAKVSALQQALDGNRRAEILASARVAAASAEPLVRKEAVSALSMLGEHGLAELTTLMADSDGEIAEDAIGAVENALMGMESEADAFMLAASYLNTFSSNEDAMRMLSGVMSSSGTQLVEPADADSPVSVAAALTQRQEMVSAFAQILEQNGGNAEFAKEAYRDITSSDWVSVAEAERWAADPDGYEAP